MLCKNFMRIMAVAAVHTVVIDRHLELHSKSDHIAQQGLLLNHTM